MDLGRFFGGPCSFQRKKRINAIHWSRELYEDDHQYMDQLTGLDNQLVNLLRKSLESYKGTKRISIDEWFWSRRHIHAFCFSGFSAMLDCTMALKLNHQYFFYKACTYELNFLLKLFPRF